METEEILHEFGLSDREIKVYITLLPLGAVNLQEIASRLDFPRTTVYNTLHYLMRKGLVATIVKKGITAFEAADPQKLLDTLNQRKKLLESALPSLQALKKTITESSGVEIYEGTKGLFTVLSDVFKVKQKTYYFGSYSMSVERLKHLPEHFRTIRMERKIPAQIVIDPYDEKMFHEKQYKKITEMRFLSSMKKFPLMIFIYGKKVAMYTLEGELIGIIISNQQVAASMKLVFDTYWSIAKPAKI
ncbi:hypothetical protein C4573_05045 [Candidatus Woesearchaeota archaeon]|nr:MAG: hypothetical protein C4573_05045 [Candidatus Woesearchaeota archaeon]